MPDTDTPGLRVKGIAVVVMQQSCRDILIVEDDAAIRDALTQILEDEGYRVVGAANGLEALQHLQQHLPPCLILLDLMMPVMNGWQFRVAQQQDPKLAPVPVIVISADRNAQQSATAINAAGFLPKPVPIDNLLQSIEQYCPSA